MRKKEFTHGFWFLLGVWAVSLAARYLVGEWMDSLFREAGEVTGAMLLWNHMRVAFIALGIATGFVVAVRYPLRPCVVFFAVECLESWVSSLGSLPGAAARGIPEVLLFFCLPPAGCAVLYLLAKGLLRLFRGREWATYIGLPVVYLLMGFASSAVQKVPLSLWAQQAGMTALEIAACFLLFLCLRGWWEKPAKTPAASPAKKEE